MSAKMLHPRMHQQLNQAFFLATFLGVSFLLAGSALLAVPEAAGVWELRTSCLQDRKKISRNYQ
uniref:Uncharacterized protein n=1 Tax=Arundo donax TaxID=35708 RepID=A0A0A9HTQ1_ARUDO